MNHRKRHSQRSHSQRSERFGSLRRRLNRVERRRGRLEAEAQARDASAPVTELTNRELQALLAE